MEILRPLFVFFAFCSLLFFITTIFHLILNIGRRLAMLQAFVTLGGLVWFITELLSVFREITFVGLVILWGIVYLTTLAILIRISGGNFRKVVLNEIREIQIYMTSLPKGLLAVLICIALGFLVLGLTAFIAAPNTWDSMTYHLSRVMHWEQNQSLAFYPTSISRQLHLGPMAEMTILNFQILAGNDRLANFVQFFAMIGCIAGVSLIAELLGGNIYAQIFSAFAAFTLPMGILQSTSTQTDYVTALWLVCFVALVLEQLQTKKPSLILSLFMGMSLGLAILTKVTAILFGASFGFWLVFGLVTRSGVKVWKHILLLLCVTMVIIAPHSFRNYKLYDNPLGPMVESKLGEYKYTNDSYGFSVLSSNILRNTGIHLALPFENLNIGVERVILWLHNTLKIDINDPRTTWTGSKFRVKYSLSEDGAGNPFHLLLIIVSVFLLVYYRKPQLVIYTLCLVAGFLLFSWFLKWQPWHSRLHLPLFVLAMSLVGVILSSYRKQWVFYVMVFILIFCARQYLFFNPRRPLIGNESILTTNRLNQYFSASPDNFRLYQQQSKVLSDLQCNDVGLMTSIDDWEYPIWVMTQAYGKDIHFEHIVVDNPSGMLETGFAPCAILVTHPFEGQMITYQNKIYIKFYEEKPLSLFVPYVP